MPQQRGFRLVDHASPFRGDAHRIARTRHAGLRVEQFVPFLLEVFTGHSFGFSDPMDH
jgi:hypothetical protein